MKKTTTKSNVNNTNVSSKKNSTENVQFGVIYHEIQFDDCKWSKFKDVSSEWKQIDISEGVLNRWSTHEEIFNAGQKYLEDQFGLLPINGEADAGGVMKLYMINTNGKRNEEQLGESVAPIKARMGERLRMMKQMKTTLFSWNTV